MHRNGSTDVGTHRTHTYPGATDRVRGAPSARQTVAGATLTTGLLAAVVVAASAPLVVATLAAGLVVAVLAARRVRARRQRGGVATATDSTGDGGPPDGPAAPAD